MIKALLLGTALSAVLISTGCATPGYTADERNQIIARDMDYNIKQIPDDFDEVFMLRPASHLTTWNVQ